MSVVIPDVVEEAMETRPALGLDMQRYAQQWRAMAGMAIGTGPSPQDALDDLAAKLEGR